MLPLGGHQAASAIGSSCVNCAAGTLRLLLLCEPRILLPPCVPAGYYFQNVLAVAAGFNPYFDGFCIPCPLGTTSLKGNFVSETEGGIHGGRKLQTAFPTLQDNLVENVCKFCPRESPRLIFAVPPCVFHS